MHNALAKAMERFQHGLTIHGLPAGHLAVHDDAQVLGLHPTHHDVTIGCDELDLELSHDGV